MRNARFSAVSMVFALFLNLYPAFALQPGEALNNPQLEARARALSSELRCLVCQNQSIDDSDAPLAGDLRRMVRERLVAGESDAQIREALVVRYGQYVLLKPPLGLNTILLWFLPFAALLLGMFFLAQAARRKKSEFEMSDETIALSSSEQEALSAILNEKPIIEAKASGEKISTTSKLVQ